MAMRVQWVPLIPKHPIGKQIANRDADYPGMFLDCLKAPTWDMEFPSAADKTGLYSGLYNELTPSG